MPLNGIEISRTFHLGDHNFFKVGQTGTISENETREELAKDAMNFISSTLKKYFPENEVIVQSVIINEVPAYFTDKEPEKELSLAEQIETVTDLKILETYLLLVKGKPEEKIYKAKLKELSK